ncbi:hypothetical protein A7U60_g3092 [Sanghuangporus baumii]|uniref:Uncharacterized protein n=1 Tax=Sanghuangporus baumii TaxID=108892 RepID=A0A9Q5I1E6_SANBA|nr:hypothetical protein A7U60_g3092 [Sanghuangporus baumii]
MYFSAKPQQDNSILGILVIALMCVLLLVLLLLTRERHIQLDSLTSIFDLAHVICIMTTLYHYLIRSFGKNKELEVLVPSLAITIGLTVRIPSELWIME